MQRRWCTAPRSCTASGRTRASRTRRSNIRSDQLADRLRAGDADQALIEPGVVESQPVGVEAELAQDRRVEVLHVEGLVDGAVAQFVGGAARDAARDAAARE